MSLSLECQVIPDVDNTYTVEIISRWDYGIFPTERWIDAGYLNLEEAEAAMVKNADRIKKHLEQR